MDDRVSIIIPCGGHHTKYIGGAVDSCLSADPPPDEIIVVDDFTMPPISLNHTPIVKVYRLKAHRGRSYARNYGVDRTHSEWLFFLDADDFLEPTAISDFQKIVEKEEADLIYADYDYINEQNERVRVKKHPFNRATNPSRRRRPIKKGDVLMIPKHQRRNLVNIGMFVRRNRFLAVNGFDEDMMVAEYWDFFIRYTMNPKIKIFKHNRPLFVARAGTSILPNAEELMVLASLKIDAMLRGGYYRKWVKS